MDSMCLKCNTDKTEFIIFSSKQQLRKLDESPLDANGNLIPKSEVVRYLGGHLDPSLTIETHIKTKVKTAMANFIKIRSIWDYLSIKACTIIILMLCITHIGYANAKTIWIHSQNHQQVSITSKHVHKINIKKIPILKFNGISLQITLAASMSKNRLQDLNTYS